MTIKDFSTPELFAELRTRMTDLDLASRLNLDRAKELETELTALKRQIYGDCEFCNGTGHEQHPNGQFDSECPHCSGRGYANGK